MEKDGRIAGRTTADAELIIALREVLAAAADTDRAGAWWDVVDETGGPHLPARHQGPVRRGAAGGRHRGQPRRIQADHARAVPYGRMFFVRKAIGWALRDHARTDPDWVRGFVEAHRSELSGLSRREALKHL